MEYVWSMCAVWYVYLTVVWMEGQDKRCALLYWEFAGDCDVSGPLPLFRRVIDKETVNSLALAVTTGTRMNCQADHKKLTGGPQIRGK